MIANIVPKRKIFVCRHCGFPELADLVVNERERRFVAFGISLRMRLPLAKFSIFLFKGCCC